MSTPSSNMCALIDIASALRSLVIVTSIACSTPHLGECDLEAARAPIYYDESGFPAYPGQALVEVSCGAGAFCHASGIAPADRLGAPLGIELDVGIALDEEGRARLAHARSVVRAMPSAILEQVVAGAMPPRPPAGEIALSAAPRYRALLGTPDEHELPAIGTEEARAVLRSWLACGAPVVEAVEGSSTGIGDIVARIDVCPIGQATCGGACIDVSADPANCGGCGVACGPEQRCTDRRCECVVALDACGPSCVELTSDPAHCGACDAACDAHCAMGACASECPSGSTDCGGSCAVLEESIAHCGACDVRCMAGETCSAGTCSCAEGYVRCGGACADVTSDAAHCGRCDMACPAGAQCVGGACACAPGASSCEGRCVSTDDDPSHCGACGNACAPGESCASGRCVGCGPPVSFAADVQPIFTAQCATSRCHSGARPQSSLSLDAGRAWLELVGVPASCGERILVTPGSEARSYLMSKLLDVDLCSGTQMPKRGESLSSAELDVIRSWICRGAMND